MSETLLFNCIVSSSVSACGEKTAEDSWIEAKTGCRFVTGSTSTCKDNSGANCNTVTSIIGLLLFLF